MFHRARPFVTFRVLIEPAAARVAYEGVAPLLRALDVEELAVVRGDVQTAAAFALGVARSLEEPGVRGRFARLAQTGELEDASVADLGRVALAAWYARHRFLLAGAARAAPLLPVALVDEALALRSRLGALAERREWAPDDPAEDLGLARFHESCVDLAGDLVALASRRTRGPAPSSPGLRAAEASSAAHEPAPREDEDWQSRDWHSHDRDGEVRRAREIGEELLARIHGANHDPESWAAQVRRAWTLLLHVYEEVRRAGLFLFPGSAGRARFPSLVQVARESGCPAGLADVYLADHVSGQESA